MSSAKKPREQRSASAVTNQKTVGQNTQRSNPRQSRISRTRKKTSAPLFYGKQILMFLALALILIILDFFIIISILIYEENSEYSASWGTPTTLTRSVGEELSYDDENNTYSLPAEVEYNLEEAQVWAILIDNSGEVVWQYDAPESVLRTYTLSDTAVFMRYGYLDDYPCFIWQRDEGLVVCAFPHDSFIPFPIRYIQYQTLLHLPSYIIGIFLFDAAVLFIIYAISKRRVVKTVEPVVDALEDLAQGKPVHIKTHGNLRDIGESINEASIVMRQKDEARKRWVSGVSHDIRTPLAISMGHAEKIAHNQEVSEDIRNEAYIIQQQNARMRDLIADLNIASKLEYDMQPLDMHDCALSKTVRAVATDYINEGLDKRFTIEVNVNENVEGVTIPLDERLMSRALRNLIDNAIRHNEQGCRIIIKLEANNAALLLSVSDDGRGMEQNALDRLNQEARAMGQTSAENPPISRIISSQTATSPASDKTQQISTASPASTIPTASQRAQTGSSSDSNNPSLTHTELGGFNEHGLGLSLVTRIVIAHGGTVRFSGKPNGGFSTLITLQRERN